MMLSLSEFKVCLLFSKEIFSSCVGLGLTGLKAMSSNTMLLIDDTGLHLCLMDCKY